MLRFPARESTESPIHIRQEGGHDFAICLERFTANLRGSLLQPGEASYDEVRKVWNGMIDRRQVDPHRQGM